MSLNNVQPIRPILILAQDGTGDINGNNQAALDAAIARLSAQGGGTLLIKKGTYTHDNGITIPANSIIEGEGEATIIDVTNTGDSFAFQNGGNNITIRNIKFTRSTGDVGRCINLRPSTHGKNYTIENCYFDFGGRAVYIYNPSGNDLGEDGDGFVKYVNIRNNWYSGGGFCYVEHCHYFEISGNYTQNITLELIDFNGYNMYGNVLNNILWNDGVNVTDEAMDFNGGNSHIIVQGNILVGINAGGNIGRYGIKLHLAGTTEDGKPNNIIVDGNYLQGIRERGISVNADDYDEILNDKIVISNNIVNGLITGDTNTSGGIMIAGGSDITVTGNFVYNCLKGILLSQPNATNTYRNTRIAVTGNSVKDCSNADIFVQGGNSYLTITGNVCAGKIHFDESSTSELPDNVIMIGNSFGVAWTNDGVTNLSAVGNTNAGNSNLNGSTLSNVPTVNSTIATSTIISSFVQSLNQGNGAYQDINYPIAAFIRNSSSRFGQIQVKNTAGGVALVGGASGGFDYFNLKTVSTDASILSWNGAGFDFQGQALVDVASVNCSPTISSGSGAPASTPAKIGDIYVDTAAPAMYYAKGNSSSADWQILTNGA